MRKKKKNLNYARNMDVDVWRENKVRKRVQMRLDESNRAFVREHGRDSDEQLIAFIRKQALSLGRMPHPLELPGGIFLHSRFRDWDKLARALGVKPVPPGQGKKLYHRLMEEEGELFARERRAMRAAKHRKKEAQTQDLPPGSGRKSSDGNQSLA